MAKEAGLAASLRKLMLHPNSKLKNLAIAVYSNIQDHFADREPMKEGMHRPLLVDWLTPHCASDC
jgi:hypothetical protein